MLLRGGVLLASASGHPGQDKELDRSPLEIESQDTFWAHHLAAKFGAWLVSFSCLDKDSSKSLWQQGCHITPRSPVDQHPVYQNPTLLGIFLGGGQRAGCRWSLVEEATWRAWKTPHLRLSDLSEVIPKHISRPTVSSGPHLEESLSRKPLDVFFGVRGFFIFLGGGSEIV